MWKVLGIPGANADTQTTLSVAEQEYCLRAGWHSWSSDQPEAFSNVISSRQREHASLPTRSRMGELIEDFQVITWTRKLRECPIAVSGSRLLEIYNNGIQVL